MKPGWHSQTYPPTGATAADGIRNQLGRPALNHLTVLVREAAQNSWDARLPNTQVQFTVEIKDLRAGVAPVWRRLLEAGAPALRHLPLRSSLSKEMRLLVVSDRGTRGLGGPTRADNAVVGENDFVAFVRNIGEPRTSEYGGGTYGFGKSIFYLVSSAATVLIYTRCRTNNGYETRLIGCSLWKSYSVGEGMDGMRYTGRHWWGDKSGDVLEPFLDNEAEQLARQLGLDAFGENETGTTIVIIDPELEVGDPDAAAAWIANAMAWNLWPKMISKNDGTPADMDFAVRRNGAQIEIPDPSTTKPLHLFVEAYRQLDKKDHQPIRVLKPKLDVGRLGLYKTMMLPFERNGVSNECGFEETSHHVCLMRTAELVVKYDPGPPMASNMTSYAGVFRANRDVDASYARAEPPTHDEWRHEPLEGVDRTIVRVTFRRIRERLSSLVETGKSPLTATADVPLGAASRRFSSLVSASFGFGGMTAPISVKNELDAGVDEDARSDGPPDAKAPETGGDTGSGSQAVEPNQGQTGEGRHRRPARPKVRYLGDPLIEDRNGNAVVVQRFKVSQGGPCVVSADVGVMIPSSKGIETSPPMGAAQPAVLGWRADDGSNDVLTLGRTLRLEGGTAVWCVVVKPAPDSVTSVELSVERLAG